MKPCPFCAEEIQDAAIKCRWCGEILPEPDGTPRILPVPESHASGIAPQNKSWHPCGVIAIGSALFLSAILTFGSIVGDPESSHTPSTTTSAKIPERMQAPPIEEIGKWEGFRGIRWGTPRSSITGLWGRMEFEDLDGYQRTGDSLSILDVTASSIIYYFQDDEFAAAQVTARGESSFIKLKEILSKRYGDPESQISGPIRETWSETSISTVGTTVALSYDKDEDVATLLFFYSPLATREGRTGAEQL